MSYHYTVTLQSVFKCTTRFSRQPADSVRCTYTSTGTCVALFYRQTTGLCFRFVALMFSGDLR